MSDEYDEHEPSEGGQTATSTGGPDEQRGTAEAPGAPAPAYPPAPADDQGPVAGDQGPAAGEQAPVAAPPEGEEAGAAETLLAPPATEEQEAGEPSDDPFAAWPQPATAALIEDVPADGVSVEHAAGELDVPDGYTVLEGTPSGHHRSVAIVVSRYNGDLTNRLLARAIEALEEAGVAREAVTIMPVPGAFELPLAAMALAKTRRYACVVALGAIVRGETPHFDYIASEAASGLQLAAIETGVPVAFGVLTVETIEQAEARIERAAEAVQTALEMADVFAQLRASARA
jgi:6,7-dimethyl-8-ribityllumazine synthase